VQTASFDSSAIGDENAFFPHCQAATEGDSCAGQQSEEDRQLDRSFICDGRFRVEDRRVDDSVEDQQYRKKAQDCDQPVDRDGKLTDSVSKAKRRHGERDDDRNQQNDWPSFKIIWFVGMLLHCCPSA
jgi:hypothetical protein